MQKLPRSKIKAETLRILQHEQEWRCAICGINMLDRGSDACLDHCHDKGHIRGVLCRNCNRGEGKIRTVANMCKRMGTKLDWMMNLLQYLVNHEHPHSESVMHPTHKTDEDKRLRRNKLARERRKANKNE